MDKEFDIVGIGSVLVDELVLLPYFPEPDTKIEIINTQKQLGGPVPTALKALSKLNKKTSFIGKVGNDYNAFFIQEKLVESGIDVSQIIRGSNSNSGFSQVWIDLSKGSRTIAFSSGTLAPLEYSDLSNKSLPDAKILHIDGREHDVIKDIIRHYKNRGSLISIDTGNFRMRTLELLETADIIIMPKRFAAELFGENSLSKLVSQMRQKYLDALAIIITDGVNGSVCSYDNETYIQKAFNINVFDTTGAGDVHSAGILYGFLNNWEIEKILEFAAAMAAIKCMNLGNNILPEYEQVIDFIEEKQLKMLFAK